ncbi:NADPH2:quinone reductase OS=Castellaniella defragrans OX=75697 GN=HNR28_003231 PE=4 SV=1 [Castellaniella defragrans]
MLYAKRPNGKPTLDCFRLEAVPVAEPAEGEVLVRNEYLSVDPYIRMRMEEKDSYAPVMKVGDVLVGRTVGQVVLSRCAGLAEGDWVVGRLGWQDYSVAPAEGVRKVSPDEAPLTAYLGALGSTGLTAWVGLMTFGRPERGETVLVSAASGAVGSVVGQLAKRAGCRAVGIAGGPKKCRVVVEEFGLDACVDYKSASFAEDLARAVPEGVDVYFDNVGGEILDHALTHLNKFARIPLCGLVSQYNSIQPYGVRNLREIFNQRVTLRGFVLSDHKDLWPAATEDLMRAYQEGALRYRETIVDGLENAPAAFMGMLDGANIGKQLVRIGSSAGKGR